MDLTTITFVSLVAIGTVNVLTFFNSEMDSRLKWFISFLVAFAVGFIPKEAGGILFSHVKEAVEAAMFASGIYKVASKMGEKMY